MHKACSIIGAESVILSTYQHLLYILVDGQKPLIKNTVKNSKTALTFEKRFI